MTDREEIADLVHRYSDSVTRFDQPMWCATWANDAHWDLGKGRVFDGFDAIRTFWLSAMEQLVIVVQTVKNGTVAVAADGATGTGRWYVDEHLHRRTGQKDILLAWYDDTYAHIDGQWKFASRVLTRLYSGPADLSAEFSPPPGSGWTGR